MRVGRMIVGDAAWTEWCEHIGIISRTTTDGLQLLSCADNDDKSPDL